jgi:Na+/phosphate symporter
MKDKHIFFNPFRMISPRLEAEAERIDDLHQRPFSEGLSLEEGLLIMISKGIEMTRLLSKAVYSGSKAQLDACEAFAKEIHAQERALTRNLVKSEVKGDLLRGLMRFPFRIERIGALMENILKCVRSKSEDGIPFSDKAHAELDQLFGTLQDMLVNFRDALRLPNKVLIQHILSQGTRLREMLEDFRQAHWDRLEAGFCSPDAGAVYLELLDSFKGANAYLEKMSNTLMEIGTKGPEE